MSLQTGGMNQLMGRIANEESIFIGGQLITAIDFQAARSGESLLRFWLIKTPLLRNQGLQFCRWVLDELSSAGDQCVRAKSKIPGSGLLILADSANTLQTRLFLEGMSL